MKIYVKYKLIKNVIVMIYDFNDLLNKYISMLENLNIGYSLSKKDLNELWIILHSLHFNTYFNN